MQILADSLLLGRDLQLNAVHDGPQLLQVGFISIA